MEGGPGWNLNRVDGRPSHHIGQCCDGKEAGPFEQDVEGLSPGEACQHLAWQQQCVCAVWSPKEGSGGAEAPQLCTPVALGLECVLGRFGWVLT